MLGGAYLCYEGAEKVYEAVVPHHAHADEEQPTTGAGNDPALEERRVAGAIKTDFILSAEIMAITLAALPEGSVWMKAVVLAIVGIGITVAVYGAVALIVKADDVGLVLARSTVKPPVGSLVRGIGRGVVKGMPILLKILSIVGTAAMVWVGGGILLHGLEGYGLSAPAHAAHDAAERLGALVPSIRGLVEWLVTAVASGLVGLLVGGALIPVASVASGLLRRGGKTPEPTTGQRPRGKGRDRRCGRPAAPRPRPTVPVIRPASGQRRRVAPSLREPPARSSPSGRRRGRIPRPSRSRARWRPHAE